MFVLLAAVSAMAAHSQSPTPETARFHLCESFVERAVLGHSEHVPEQWSVYVELTTAGTSALAEFTRAHLGEVVQVSVASTVVVEANVQTIVDSGRIQSGARAKLAAAALAKLLGSPPSSPCGVQESAVQGDEAGRP